MKTKQKKRQLSFVLCMALTVAVAFFTAGCNGKTGADAGTGNEAGAGAQAGAEGQGTSAEAGSANTTEEGRKDPDASGIQDGTERPEAKGAADAQTGADDVAAGADDEAPEVVGTGSTVFTLSVTAPDGSVTEFEVHTDQKTVGDALVELGLIEGEESEYGLFVKTVNGITADYDTDGVYWAFYVGEDYATESVSATDITDGGHYALQVE